MLSPIYSALTSGTGWPGYEQEEGERGSQDCSQQESVAGCRWPEQQWGQCSGRTLLRRRRQRTTTSYLWQQQHDVNDDAHGDILEIE